MNIEKSSSILMIIFLLMAIILGSNTEFFTKKIGSSALLIELIFLCLGDLFFIINVFSVYYKFKRYFQITLEIICILTVTVISILTHFDILENIYHFITIFPLILIISSRIKFHRLRLKNR